MCHIWQTVIPIIHATYGRQSHQSYMPHVADGHINHTCHIWQMVIPIIHATYGRQSHQSYMPHMADDHINHTCHIWQTVTPFMADSHTIYVTYGKRSHHICHIWQTVTPIIYVTYGRQSHIHASYLTLVAWQQYLSM